MSAHTAITSQPAHVFRPDELPAKSRGGGARTIPLVTAARGGTSYLNGITIFEPGAQIGHHTHNIAESVMVIQGSAIVDIDGERTELRTFDTTFVPANIPHHFENTSHTQQMRIFWTYGSLDATRTVLATGETGRVDSESAALAAPVRLTRQILTVDVIPGHEQEFEQAVSRAVPVFQRTAGARGLSLEASDDPPRTYRLSIVWEDVGDHHDLAESDAFRTWRHLIDEHVAGAPRVERLRTVLVGF